MRKLRVSTGIGGEQGIALVLSLFIMLAMSVVAASLMFLSQTETYSSMNYRMMSQARYGAESGIQMAANFLLNESGAGYVAPATGGADPIGSYVTTVSPVTFNGKPVVLSANAGVASNYPIAAVQTAFNTAVKGTLAEGNTNVAYAPYATLVSMQEIGGPGELPSVDGALYTVQTWQITADGNITAGTRTATEEVTAILDTQVESTTSPAVSYGAFATSATCGALKFSGGASTKSYDGSAALVGGNPVTANNSGNVGTNGNLTESGSATINGTLSTPRVGVGGCSAGNVDADTSSGGASVTGGIVHLPSAVSLPTPNIPTPSLGAPTATNLNINNSSRCTDAAIVAIVPAANCSLTVPGVPGALTITATGATPLVLGNISVTSSGSLTIASSASTATYTMGTLSVAGAGHLNMGTTGAGLQPIILNATSISSSGGGAATLASATVNTDSISISGGTSLTLNNNAAVTMNIVDTFTMSGGGALTLGSAGSPASLAMNVVNTAGVTTPLDFSGGTVANPSFDSSKLQIQYGGTGNIGLSGGTSQAEVIYAPNAPVSFSGGSALYGEVIAATITDSGGATIFYDRNLATKGLFSTTKYFTGNPMLSSFSWKKY
jgi:hypothetical protein